MGDHTDIPGGDPYCQLELFSAMLEVRSPFDVSILLSKWMNRCNVG
jgi:hypothetical protein